MLGERRLRGPCVHHRVMRCAFFCDASQAQIHDDGQGDQAWKSTVVITL